MSIDRPASVSTDGPDQQATTQPGPPDDEALAARARARFRRDGLPTLDADATAAGFLGCHEQLVSIHRGVRLERRHEGPVEPAGGPRGDLYLTSRRIVLVGRPCVEIPLESIRETGLAGERLFLVLKTGMAVALDLTLPRLLRVEIATARAAARQADENEG